MFKLNITLTKKFFLILWFFGLIPIFLSFYFSIKYSKYPIKSELKLPDEYRLFLEHMYEVNLTIQKTKSLNINFRSNPFFDEKAINQVKGDEKIKHILNIKLTTILHHDKKVCIINEKLYREGDKIGKIKIEYIGDYYVILKLPDKRKVRLEVGSSLNIAE